MLGTILFFALALVAVLSAIGMLTSTNAVHAALFLVVNFVCIALFYLGLSAPFLAMVQVTVYAGAIMVLFLFVIMLLGAERIPMESNLRWQTPLALVLIIALIMITAFIVLSPLSGTAFADVGPVDAGQEAYGGPKALGELLFTAYILPFELTGILLLVAMIGAIVLTKEEKKTAKKKRVKQDQEREITLVSTAD